MKKIGKIIVLTCCLMIVSLSLAFSMGEAEQDRAYTATGTGFFINTDGVLITNAHVIEGAEEIYVIINNDYYPAKIIRQNERTDLALLKIDYKNPYHFKIIDFNTTNLGDKLSVLGYPLTGILTQDIRFTEGSLSARSGIESNSYYFQHSAPTHPGNSGGPIMNSRFEIIGVATASISDSYVKNKTGSNPQNIHFGVKSNYINSILSSPFVGEGIIAGNGNIRSISDAEKATVQIINYWTEVNTSLIITNNTGYVINELYVAPTSSDSWGSNRLGTFIISLLQNNSSKVISSLRSNNRYDIQLVDRDGDTYTKWNVLLKPNQNIVFTVDDID
jgi:S1-C subfamily serine protease